MDGRNAGQESIGRVLEDALIHAMRKRYYRKLVVGGAFAAGAGAAAGLVYVISSTR
jgi:hypothetical protein